MSALYAQQASALDASDSPAAPKLGALQSRIADVLSSSYSDVDIRDALHTLDLKGIKNTPESRRNLRLQVQQELIDCDGAIIDDFGRVADQLRRVGTAISELNKTCATIRSHVATAKRETGLFLDEGSQLTSQKRQIEVKQTLLQAFNNHFILSDVDVRILTSNADPVTSVFFDTLDRAKQIHRDSQTLLESEDQALGVEILDRCTTHLDAAFQKLFRWTQRELRTVDLENPQLSEPIRRAIRVLAERPALFDDCLDFFAQSREQVLSESFYTALTGVQTNGMTGVRAGGKAIEMNAHDPMRYVGDMLAWVHAAIVSEREALKTLFVSDAEAITQSLRAARQSQPWLLHETDTETPVDGHVFDGNKTLSVLVDRDLGGVMRQLRQRLEQSLYSHDDALLAYQIRNLVVFYSSTFKGLLGGGDECSSERALQPVITMAMTQFKTITRDHIANLHVDVTVAPPGLTVPDFLVDALEALKALMQSYETSVGAGPEAAGFAPVLIDALDPYMNGCEDMGNNISPPGNLIFGINCLAAARSALKGPAYTAERVEEIEESIAERERQLVDYVQSWFVAESGMHSLLEAVEAHGKTSPTEQDMEKMAKLRLLRVDTLAEVGQRLDAFLPTAMEDARHTVETIGDKAVLRQICDEAADEFAARFETVERILDAIDEHGGDGQGVLLRDVFPRTSDEVRVLLS